MDGELSAGITREAVRRLQRQAGLTVFLAETLRVLTLLAVLLGALALLLRGPASWTRSEVLRLVPLLALAPLVALVRARSRRLSASAAAVRLELATGSTGGLLLDLERDDPRWRPRASALLAAREAAPPLVQTSALRAPAAALAFLALALAVRIPPPPTPAGTALWMAGALGGLAEELRVLGEEVVLDPEVQDELSQRLEDLTERLDDADPEALLEAFDALDARFGEAALAASHDAGRALESLGGMLGAATDTAPEREALAAAGRELLERLGGPEALARVAPELAATFAGLDGLDGLAELDPERARELAERLVRLSESDLARRAQALAAAGVLREGAAQDLLERLARAAERRARGDGARRGVQGPFGSEPGRASSGSCAACGSSTCSGSGSGSGNGTCPGGAGLRASGEPGPGGGSGWPLGPDAAAAGASGEFDVLVGLPTGLDGVSLGESPGAPEVAPEGEAAGLAEFDARIEGAAWRRRIAPRHRSAVRTFFDTQAADAAGGGD